MELLCSILCPPPGQRSGATQAQPPPPQPLTPRPQPSPSITAICLIPTLFTWNSVWPKQPTLIRDRGKILCTVPGPASTGHLPVSIADFHGAARPRLKATTGRRRCKQCNKQKASERTHHGNAKSVMLPSACSWTETVLPHGFNYKD